MSPLQRVQNFLGQYPDLSIILFDSSTHTSELAAQALGVKPAQIAKTLCFVADGRPLLLTTCGDTRTDVKELAKVLGVKKVKFADAETVERETGFPPGGVSPVGLLPGVPLYLDRSLWQFDIVYAAAGTANSALPVSPDRLQEITGATVVEVCK